MGDAGGTGFSPSNIHKNKSMVNPYHLITSHSRSDARFSHTGVQVFDIRALRAAGPGAGPVVREGGYAVGPRTTPVLSLQGEFGKTDVFKNTLCTVQSMEGERFVCFYNLTDGLLIHRVPSIPHFNLNETIGFNHLGVVIQSIAEVHGGRFV